MILLLGNISLFVISSNIPKKEITTSIMILSVYTYNFSKQSRDSFINQFYGYIGRSYINHPTLEACITKFLAFLFIITSTHFHGKRRRMIDDPSHFVACSVLGRLDRSS